MPPLMEAIPTPATLGIMTSSGYDHLEGPFHVPSIFVLTQHLCFCCPIFLSPSALPDGLSSAICSHFQSEVLIHKQETVYGVSYLST